jgi:hypothetical protein
MTEYISENNQHILWNAIQRVQVFHETIRKTDQSVWFKNVIRRFYMENKDRILSATELKELNRATISYMVQILQPAPETKPKFKEDLTDGVIENMGELLQQQMKQRELDVMNPNNIMDQIALLKLEIKNLSETVKSLSVEFLSIKKSISVPELEETA